MIVIIIAHIFKTTAPICVSFGTLQCRVVLNMSVYFIFINSVLHKMAPPGARQELPSHFPLLKTKGFC